MRAKMSKRLKFVPFRGSRGRNGKAKCARMCAVDERVICKKTRERKRERDRSEAIKEIFT